MQAKTFARAMEVMNKLTRVVLSDWEGREKGSKLILQS